MSGAHGTPTVDDAVRVIGDRLGARRPEVALVLGSGAGGIAARIADPVRIPYGAIPGFPATAVAGHGGELVAGTLAGREVVVQSGRFHLYEGHDPAVATLPVRVFGALGIGTLILTNAAGAIRPTFPTPALMLIADHVNLMFRSPLAGPVVPGDQRFPDMSAPYDPALCAAAREVARRKGIALEEGVYAAVLGPSYETPAEIRMLARLGADAVGMSTVPEVIAARARGIRCLAISVLTNPAAGFTGERLSHADVLASAARVEDELAALLEGVVAHDGARLLTGPAPAPYG